VASVHNSFGRARNHYGERSWALFDPDEHSRNVVTANPLIDSVLERYHHALGGHLHTYRNHVYRGLTYHQLLLGHPVPDSVALAWAVHDLGIWTAATFDYLTPSADLASAHADEFGITDIEHVQMIITQHHKVRPARDHLTETFRIADLTDVSRGALSGPITRACVKAVVAQFPYLGFHAFLVRGLARHAVGHPARPFPMLRW
jgi:hypothetical protein